MYTLKSIARRGTLLGAAFALLASSLLPALPVYADSLNPLTERSLTLSSSAPGWDDLDGSGNTTYAPPNSGANGGKVGNTFEFKVNTTTTPNLMKAMSFQYCKTPAGQCWAPGDNGYTGTAPTAVRNGDSTSTSDLNVTEDDSSEATLSNYVGLGGAGTGTITADDASTAVTGTGTNFDGQLFPGDTITGIGVVLSIQSDTALTLAANASADAAGVAFTYSTNGRPRTIPAASSTGLNYMVYKLVSGTKEAGVWAPSTGWVMSVDSNESGLPADSNITNAATGANNEIQLVNTTGDGFTSGQLVRVVFFATDTNYITNPGSGHFFVRINTYSDEGNITDFVARENDVIDGGVTVANVMNLGIQIVTKVLETMSFSVGVVDPYTLESDETAGGQLAIARGGTPYTHGACEPIMKWMVNETGVPNRLQLGDPSSEYALSVDNTYSTHSYFRLSSNSSAGASIYYSGNTLSNTVGDRINAIGDGDDNGISTGVAAAPAPGNEQFGLALAHNQTNPYGVDYRTETKSGYVYETGVDLTEGNIAAGLATYPTQGIHSSVTDDAISDLDFSGSTWHSPQLTSLVPAPQYANGAGYVNTEYNNNALTNSQFNGDPTAFAFKPESMLVPELIASDNGGVVDCVTGKVRYIANIAATTPAGIYTTKINYIAAPQY